VWRPPGPRWLPGRPGGAALPVGRIGRPAEVSAAVLFPMTNGFVTGTVLSIDGGGSLI